MSKNEKYRELSFFCNVNRNGFLFVTVHPKKQIKIQRSMRFLGTFKNSGKTMQFVLQSELQET